MTLRSVPIDSITEDHLQYLIDDQVAEDRTIEYKRKLPGNADNEKKEFLADVCAFANAAGGDLVYGINATGGIPRERPGFETSDIDAETLRLEHLIRTGIGPRLSVKPFKTLKLSNGYHALVIRVPRSFARPHVVDFKGRWRFYMRSSAGKYPMDVDEVRRAFVLSESIADRIRAFRDDRLGRVVSGETPVPIRGTARVVFHMAPLSAFDSPASSVNLDLSRPPLSSRGGSRRYNFDGVLWDYQQSCDNPVGAKVVSYVQLFRTGVLEAVDNSVFVEEEEASAIPGHIPSLEFDKALIERAHSYLGLLRELGVEPPIFLMLSLVGVRGYKMQNPPLGYHHMGLPIDRDALVVPEAMVENLEEDPPAVQRHMRPLLDAVWNACDFPRSPHYDESGTFSEAT